MAPEVDETAFVVGFLMVAVLFIHLEWKEKVAKGRDGIKTASTSDMWQGRFQTTNPERGGARFRDITHATAAARHNLGFGEKVTRKMGWGSDSLGCPLSLPISPVRTVFGKPPALPLLQHPDKLISKHPIN